MASLVVLPQRTDAFKNYRQSKNALTDIISSSSKANAGKVVTLSVKPPKPPPEYSRQLAAINAVVPLILAGKPTEVSYHEVVDCCRRLVLHAHVNADEIYRNIDIELQKSVERIARECQASILSRQGKWLETFVSAWDQYTQRVGLLSALFVYLDRVHAMKEGSGISSIQDRAETQFRKLWSNELLFQKTRDDILAWASSERESGEIDVELRTTVKAVVSIAETLKVYSTLSRPYVDVTREYYEDLAGTRAANVQSESYSGTDYVKWAVDKEKEECQRTEQCFSLIVTEEVIGVFRHVTGKMFADQIIRKALDEALYRADTDALNRLFVYAQQSQAFKAFTKAMHDHIEARIRSLISDPANDRQMIASTLKLKRFVDKAVAGLFEAPVKPITAKEDGDVDMEGPSKLGTEERNKQLELEHAVRSGFKSGLGSRQNAPAEEIAKYLDYTMRKGQESSTEAEFNVLLDEIVALVGYTPDKDVFRAFYSTGLAKRLLLNKSASNDMERNMITKLQKEMGEEYTSGDVMMKDLQLSETLVKAYQSARAKDPSEFKDSSDFTANVLTESAWPQYPLLKDGWDFKLTPQLQSSIDTFTKWYGTQHKNRALSWRHQLGTVTLTARFDSGKYEIGVSLFQAVVLLQFNDDDVLDFTELKSRTGIEASELARILQSLSLGKKGTRVLIKRPAGKDVEPTDKFAFNTGFKAERFKFRINQIQQSLSAEESRQTNEQVALDRVSVLEATIVRIMKGRKKLTLTLLIDAVVSDVSKRFPPDVKEIKKRVESLIDREFLKRDDEDRNTLHYLA